MLPDFIIDQMYIQGAYHHPTFLYESLWNLIGFILINIFYKKKKFDGQMIVFYITWYCFGRFFIEGLRTDSLMAGTIRTSQLVAILAIVGGIILFLLLRRRSIALPKALVADEESTLALNVEAAEETPDTEENVNNTTEETTQEDTTDGTLD